MTDFFDDDLVKKRDAQDVKNIRFGPGGAASKAEPGASSDMPVKPVSDINLTRMARHKEQVEDQVATALKELERLKQRQKDLEKQKGDLEELRRKQEEYGSGKRDMIEHLGQSLILLEKEEIKATQRVDILQDSRRVFKARLQDIENLKEEDWEENKFREELNKALTVIEDARGEYNKLMARIDALAGSAESGRAATDRKPVIFEERDQDNSSRSFSSWLLIGLAVSTPLLLGLLVLGALMYLMHTGHI